MNLKDIQIEQKKLQGSHSRILGAIFGNLGESLEHQEFHLIRNERIS